MNLLRFLTAASQSPASSAEASTPWFFWVIVGTLAVGFVVMIVQNFIIKKEEYYK